MDFSTLKALTFDGVVLKDLYINGVLAWKKPSGYTNWVPLSINSDGSIYNSTGYKNDYRIRSGGAEAAQGSTSCTGFIKVNPGDVIRMSGWDAKVASTGNAINCADSSFTNIGQIVGNYPAAGYGIFAYGAAYQSYCYNTVVEETTGVYKWVVPPAASGVAYIRVTGYDYEKGAPGANMIVTVNEEITE